MNPLLFGRAPSPLVSPFPTTLSITGASGSSFTVSVRTDGQIWAGGFSPTARVRWLPAEWLAVVDEWWVNAVHVSGTNTVGTGWKRISGNQQIAAMNAAGPATPYTVFRVDFARGPGDRPVEASMTITINMT